MTTPLSIPYQLPDPYTQADIATTSAFINTMYANLTQYGSFYDTTSQTSASTSNVQIINIGQQDGHNGVNLSGAGRITFTQGGVYHVGHGIQFANSDTVDHDVQVWIRKNGTDLAFSTASYSIPAKHGTTEGHLVANDTNIYQFAANDYIEIWWHTNDLTTYIVSLPASTTPAYPVAPSVTVDVLFAALL